MNPKRSSAERGAATVFAFDIKRSVKVALERYGDEVLKYDQALRRAANTRGANKLALLKWLLSWEDQRDLRDPFLRRLMNYAMDTNDHRLLAAISSGLKPAGKPPIPKENVNRVKEDLIRCWYRPNIPDRTRSFCYWPDSALALWFQKHRSRPYMSEKAIRKIWERLGLIKGTPLLRLGR